MQYTVIYIKIDTVINKLGNGIENMNTYILSVSSPFYDRVGVPLHNILSRFLSVMDIFFVNLKFCHIHFYTL